MSVPSATLADLGRAYKTSKIVHGYLPTFERYLEPLRYESFDLLEIGVHQGASIRMWHDYFPNARIIGLDIKNSAPNLNLARYTFVQGDQGDQALLERLSREYRLRVIVDDGSHRWPHQINTFRTLFPAMAPYGIYICEDLITSFGTLAKRYGNEIKVSAADFFLNLARIVLAGSAWNQEKGNDEETAISELASLINELRIVHHGIIIERSEATPPRSKSDTFTRSHFDTTSKFEPKEEVARSESAIHVKHAVHNMGLCQILMTRFNIRSAGVGYTEKQPAQWLDERLVLFERYCLPSISGQTLQEFTWVIFCDEHTPAEILERIRSYDTRIQVARFAPQVGVLNDQTTKSSSDRYFQPGSDPVFHTLSPSPFVSPDTAVVVSTRIDNDDAMRIDALERVKSFAPRFLETGHERMVYNPLLGYKFDAVQSRLYATQMHNSPFLSFFERLSESVRPIGAFSGNHSHMHNQFPTHHADGSRLWVQVLHEGNVSNHVKSTDVELPVEELRADFGFLLPPS